MSATAKDCASPLVVVAGEYHKYWIGFRRNPKFNESCRYVLDLKDKKERKHQQAVAHFGRKVAARLKELVNRKEPIIVAIVPGHTADSCSPGLRSIVRNHLRPVFNIANKRNPLRRHTTTKKRAKGGDRSAQNIRDTVEVLDDVLTPGCTVVLLDDVTTTGTSLQTCAELLLENGASNVICMALMKTADD